MDMPDMPRMETIGRYSILRTKGTLVEGDALGVGFLHKSCHYDLVNWRFPNFVLVLVLQGGGSYMDSKGLEYKLKPGSTFVRIPELEHSNYVDEHTNYLECYLEIGPLLFNALCSLRILELATPVHNINLEANSNIPRRIWHLGWRLANCEDDEFSECAAEMVSILGEIQLLSHTVESGEKYRDLIEQACRELGDNFSRPFSLQDFCRSHNVGYENFRKLFKQRTGISPKKYRIRSKMDVAIAMLRDSSYPMPVISERLGYNDVREFNAQFKGEIGISPGKYRNQEKA